MHCCSRKCCVVLRYFCTPCMLNLSLVLLGVSCCCIIIVHRPLSTCMTSYWTHILSGGLPMVLYNGSYTADGGKDLHICCRLKRPRTAQVIGVTTSCYHSLSLLAMLLKQLLTLVLLCALQDLVCARGKVLLTNCPTAYHMLLMMSHCHICYLQ